MITGKQTTHFPKIRQPLPAFLHVNGLHLHRQFQRRTQCKRYHSLRCRGQSGDPFDDVFAEQFRMAERLQREMDIMDQTIARQVEKIEKSGARKSGDFSWSREWKSESPGQRVYFSESITVYNGQGALYQQSPYYLSHHPGLSFPGLLLLSALLGAWLSVTVAFNKRYHMTVYAENRRWMILILWPLLLLFSPKFREEFFTVLHKMKNRLKHRVRYQKKEEVNDNYTQEDMTDY